MGWFDEQIRLRRLSDQEAFDEAFVHAAGAILGTRIAEAMSDDRVIAKNVIEEILKYYHLKPTALPEEITDIDSSLDYLLRPHGLMRRNVDLKPGWYKEAFGPMIGILAESRTPVALLPWGLNGYAYKDPLTGKRCRLNAREAAKLEKEALCFYHPLPQKKLGIKDLFAYMGSCFSLRDLILVILLMFVGTLLGMLVPRIIRALMGPVLRSHSPRLLGAISIFLICITISSNIMSTLQSLISERFTKKMDLQVEAAGMIRLLTLPTSFFRSFSSGEISSRLSSLNELCTVLINTVLNTGLTSLFSLMYIGQISRFAPSLVVPALVIILATVVVSTAATILQMNLSQKQIEYSAANSGMAFALLSGIQKIRLAGAEKRAFARWLNGYSLEASIDYSPPLFVKVQSVIIEAISLVGTIFFYYYAIQAKMHMEDYYAFTAAYAMVLEAFTSLAGITTIVANIKPILTMAEPILKAVPEGNEGRAMVTSLSGRIQLDNISFRYSDDTPWIIDDLSLKIEQGEYIAIVGHTGCGKSTLMRLMLGFETPQQGAVYYDGRDLKKLDLKSVRQKIGTVIQNGNLFSSDIFSNIAIC